MADELNLNLFVARDLQAASKEKIIDSVSGMFNVDSPRGSFGSVVSRVSQGALS